MAKAAGKSGGTQFGRFITKDDRRIFIRGKVAKAGETVQVTQESAASSSAPVSYSGDVNYRNTTREDVAEALRERGITPEQLVAAAVPDDTLFPKAEVSLKNSIIVVRATNGNSYVERVIERDASSKTVHNESFTLAESLRGSGVGTDLFASQVRRAEAAGFDRFETMAVRSDKQNGYYTWARLGYDGTIPPKAAGRLPEHLSGARMVSDLMRTESGRAWWKENGESFRGFFDTRGGSVSRTLLEAYVASKKH